MNLSYFKDTLISVAFWVPIVGLMNYVILGLSGWQLYGTMMVTGILNLLLGGAFARTLDVWRKKLNYSR